MKIHYFQRYHQKENVATANTMLLLSRLYQFSSDKFFEFLRTEISSDSFKPEIIFTIQEKSNNSVPDAAITQESFKIVVETKMHHNDFSLEQLLNHLTSFKDEKYKILISLAPDFMDPKKKECFEKELEKYNLEHKCHIIHINTTFEEISNSIKDVIEEKDYEMQDVLEDYLDYCYNDNLIIVPDSWKYMRVQLAGTTFDFNVRENIYYDDIDRGFRAHDYLGLYRGKSVRAIGKIEAIITAVGVGEDIIYQNELGELTEERRQKIQKAIEDGKNYGYSLNRQRYFFVNKFYETDFKKITPRAPMGTRIFDLSEILETNDLPEVKQIAKQLNEKTWQ